MASFCLRFAPTNSDCIFLIYYLDNGGIIQCLNNSVS